MQPKHCSSLMTCDYKMESSFRPKDNDPEPHSAYVGVYLSQRVPQVLLGIPKSSHKPACRWQSPYLPVFPLQLQTPSSSVYLASDTLGRSPLPPLFMVLSWGQCQGLKVPHTAFALGVITTGTRPLGSGSLTPSPIECKEWTPLWAESLSTRSPGSGHLPSEPEASQQRHKGDNVHLEGLFGGLHEVYIHEGWHISGIQ